MLIQQCRAFIFKKASSSSTPSTVQCNLTSTIVPDINIRPPMVNSHLNSTDEQASQPTLILNSSSVSYAPSLNNMNELSTNPINIEEFPPSYVSLK